jgi:DNA-binding transcriptional ArsR family regulator
MSKSVNEARLLRAIAEPTRQRLLVSLLDNGPQYISQLAKALNMDRTTISYNLSILEGSKILDSDYTILTKPHSKGKAARVYSVNHDKLKEALGQLKAIQQKIK